MADPEIEGLPPGAVVTPINQGIEGLPPGATVTPIGGEQAAAPAAPTPEPTMGQTVMQGAKDFGKGVLKSGVDTVANIDAGMRKIPGVGQFLTTPLIGHKTADQSIAEEQSAAQPHGIMQSIGKGLGSAAQFLIPGGAEEKAGAMLAEHAPQLGKLAAPLGRAAAQTLSSAGINKAQGGSASTGAMGGAAGGILGEGARAAAPLVAESALGVRMRDRLYGRTPGEAIINDTTGVRPATIAASAQSKMNELTPQLENLAAQSPNQASLLPARGTVDSAMTKSAKQGAKKVNDQLQPLANSLKGNQVTGQMYPPQVSPFDLINIKRGFAEDHIGGWNPEATQTKVNTAKQAYHSMADELHNTVPGSRELDQRISSLIPVANRATASDAMASTGQRILGRFGKPTGALAGAGIGAGAGYHEDGVTGAIAGGLTGLVAPEILASPTTQMVAARMLSHPAKAIRPLVGAGLQAKRLIQDGDN